MMQHEHHDRDVEFLVGDRQRLELAAPDVHVARSRSRRLRGLQHLAAAIDGDHLRDKRRQRLAGLARAAAEVADDPVAHRTAPGSACR